MATKEIISTREKNFIIDTNLSILDIQESKFSLKKLDKLVGVVENPIRGTLNINVPALFRTFEDITERKKNAVTLLGNLLQKKFTQEVYDALWRITNSKLPGIDISFIALQQLKRTENIPQEQINQLLKIVQSNPHSRAGRFAAYILKNREIKCDYQLLDKLATEAKFYNPDVLINISKEMKPVFGALGNWARIELLRLIKKRIESDDIPSSFMQLIGECVQVVHEKINLIERKQSQSNGVTLGIEVQGTLPESLPLVGKNNKTIFTSLSPNDYQEAMNVGEFIKSNDEYFEFSSLPTQNPGELALIIQTLSKMNLLPNPQPRKATSIDITIGGLKSSRKHRESMAIQLMTLATDYCTFTDEAGWNLNKNKSAIRNRRNSELQQTSNERTSRYATELRMLALDKPKTTYKVMYVIKTLADLALEKQKSDDKESFDSVKMRSWGLLLKQFNQLFIKHGLPLLTDQWTGQDLSKLETLMKGENREQFIKTSRTLITNAHIEQIRDDEQTTPNEVIASEKLLNTIERSINSYSTLLHKLQKSAIQ